MPVLIEKIKNINFFKDLNQDTLESIVNASAIYTYNKNQILYYESDDVHNVFYLIEGEIKFYKVDRFDNEIFLYNIYAPRLLFDVSKLSNDVIMHCFANAEFNEDSTVLAIDAQKFRDIFLHNMAFMQKILQESFQTVAQLECVINRDVVFDGTAKVAHFLVTEGERVNQIKKHEVAYMLHIQPETLSRILKKLVRNDIIAIEKHQVKILDIDALKKIYQ